MNSTNSDAFQLSARKTVALNIRLQRVRRDLTQEELSIAAGINRGYVGQIEKASRAVSIDMLAKIAHALAVPVSELLKD